MYRIKTTAAGFTTGWPTLDSCLERIKPSSGDLMLLGGSSGSGKSLAALQIGMHMALQGASVNYTSLEMNKHDIANRMVSQVSGFSWRDFTSAEVPRESKDVAKAAFDKNFRRVADRFEVSLYTQGKYTAVELMMRAIARECNVFILDYIGIAKNVRERGEAEYQMFKRVTGEIKALASEYKIATIILTQLNADGAIASAKDMINDATIALTWKTSIYSKVTGLLPVTFHKSRHHETKNFQLKDRKDIARMPEATEADIEEANTKLAEWNRAHPDAYISKDQPNPIPGKRAPQSFGGFSSFVEAARKADARDQKRMHAPIANVKLFAGGELEELEEVP